MSNTNCLDGLACPECHATEPLYISGNARFTVYDAGCDEFEYLEWSADSTCTCIQCGHSATVTDFGIEKTTGKE